MFGGKNKNWLPPVYGKKNYDDMSQEEKDVVEQFEGRNEYQDTIKNESFYFGGCNMMALASAN